MDTKQWKICAAYYLLSTRYVEHGSSRLTNSRYKKKSPNHYFTKRTILSLSLSIGRQELLRHYQRDFTAYFTFVCDH